MQLLSLALVSMALTAALASAQPDANATAWPAPRVPSNSSHAGHARWTACRVPPRSFGKWWYGTRSNGPYYCYGPDYQSWSMLSSYRAGGVLNVHWKYTDNVNDPDCLSDWDYYAEDGTTLIAKIRGRTTLERDTRRWCALPVYRSGGVEYNQWEYCSCWDEGLPAQ
jgi:hypothetical protein